jgi:regulator of replication initiation timing
MGKKARLKARRLAEAKGAKNIFQQLTELEKEIAVNEAELKSLEQGKAAVLEGLLTENTPPGWQQKPLGDVLNRNQIQAVVDIFNRTDIDDIAQTKLVKQYLSQFTREINAAGYDVGFLAYALLANKAALQQMSAASNEPEDPLGGTLSRN